MTTKPDRRQRLVNRAVALMVDAFDDYNARFSDITRRAARHFAHRDWQAQQRSATERIGLYDVCIAETIDRLEHCLNERLLAKALWLDIRTGYAAQVEQRIDAELYKTFFNTLTRRLFKTRGVQAAIEFVALDIEPTEHITHPIDRFIYSCREDATDAMQRMLQHVSLKVSTESLLQDAAPLAQRLRNDVAAVDPSGLLSLELLKVVFYRDQRAYLIGRAFGQDHWLPCVIALIHDDRGVRVDAVLTERLQVSILFGFTYSYFQADLPTIGDAVVFLRTLLPNKPVDELYTVLGRAKQGKTERYRHLFHHLNQVRDEHMTEAEGQRGMVMVVFTLPSYPLVFKLVRDHFAPGKKIGREHVLSQYRLVFNHDRVGRLIDAQEYRHLSFDRALFSDALLEELQTECGRIVQVSAQQVTIAHCFVQRRVRPLDLFIHEVSTEQAHQSIIDYGQAIRDLARSNLFPGDLFLKNFGVTASRRTVFYDFDEVRRVTDCNFRRIPPARTEDQLMSDEIWYAVEPGDAFPEQFQQFMDLSPEHRSVFQTHHADLFDPSWWQALKQRLIDQPSRDVRPYPDRACMTP
ncbi:MAG: bifunctional isocitrate dehydrogenase kinase/phosphatase [Pseudomonadota bacterium]